MNKQRKVLRSLDSAIARLKRLVESEGRELVRDRRVRSALRELEKSRKGQVDQERLIRAVSLLSEAACDMFVERTKRRDQR